MGRIGTAFRLFFRALGDKGFAEQGARLLEGSIAAPVQAAPKPAVATSPTRTMPPRSEAITLLAVLQREARLVDFLKEDIASFDNAQIGAAVRDVHRDAGVVLERLFSLRPVMNEGEGTEVRVPAGSDAGRVRLTGNVSGQPPFRGTLRHQGWEVSRTLLPEWNGSSASAQIVAPAEVELA